MAKLDCFTDSESATDAELMQIKDEKRTYICDRCGHEMHEKNCKVLCPNCGNRFDCSDLNLYFD